LENLIIKLPKKLYRKLKSMFNSLKKPELNIVNKNANKTILVMHYVEEKKIAEIPKTVIHHLFSFEKYSQYNVHYLHVKDLLKINLDSYDAIILHYYSQVYLPLSNSLINKLKKYQGKKVFFVQDDYDEITMNRKKYLDCKIDFLYTPVDNKETIEFLYPNHIFNHIKINTYLTGYCESSDLSSLEIRNISERNIDIFYRGNDIGLAYGNLGQEKYEIGVKINEFFQNSCLRLDISCFKKDQIYGIGYFQKMCEAKATLMTESGSSIIFEDPRLMKQRDKLIALFRSKNQEISIKKLKEQYYEFFSHEGKYKVAVISPKVFEAIICKTALIGFAGNYSGVLKPHEHYIVLNKDFSNIDEVKQKLADTQLLQDMVDRAYQDIYLSGHYSYQNFVKQVEEEIFGS
jgi:hypothetical protein